MTSNQTYNVLELFSGIGGMHYALNETVFSKKINEITAMDVNDIGNKVYEYNFKKKPKATNLDSMNASRYNHYKPDIILMSPPCQPYTRTGNQLNLKDKRSISFISFLNSLSEMNSLNYFLLENVYGFERSESRQVLVEKCLEAGFQYQEFLINPTDLNIPNSRLRYYFIAKRENVGNFKIAQMNKRLFCSKKTMIIDTENNNLLPLTLNEEELINEIYKVLFGIDVTQMSCGTAKLAEFLGDSIFDTKLFEDYSVPEKIIEKYLNVYDIVEPHSVGTCCFTKGYTKYAQGTGSILKLDFKDGKATRYRYFTEYEIAKLMGFPVMKNKFEFPPEVSLKNRYKLLGNSLNVLVVSRLINYMLS
ncbi:S-adenosyl-L-methionine-dependent methyltransferase [Neoconidiobolus thromboides FSU 785]|nr:S-adenosyl-L-methionine-dependent methyltransferase [Neoconidiobolus thromboides FSU 785]